MRNLDKIFKVVAFLLLLLLSITSKAQVPLYQLEYAIDSNYVIGALPSGEPVWVRIDSLGLVMGGSTQYLNPYIIGGDTVGFYLTVAVDTVLFVNTIDTSAASGIDSTNIIGGWGIDATESPSNTWNLIVDSSQVATQYGLSLKVGGSGTSTRIPFWSASNTLSSSANLFWDNTNNEIEVNSIPIGSKATNQLYIGSGAATGATSASDSYFFGYLAGSGATSAANSYFFGYESGVDASLAPFSTFAGYRAGYQATNATYSNFFGHSAGYQATNLYHSNAFGQYAGYGATSSEFGNFFGYQAGRAASAAPFSNFFGYNAGLNATNAGYSNMFGHSAADGATNASFGNFFGYQAGKGATAGSFSNFFGYNTGLTFTGNNLGSNNIIIGNNISLPNATSNAMNLGGVLFGTGFQSVTSGDPKIAATSGGKIGVMTVTPARELHVTGEVRITDLTTDTPTKIVGADGDGDLAAIKLGNGVILSNDTLKVDSSKFATTYDLSQVSGSSSKAVDILGSDFTTSATSLQTTDLAYTFSSTGTYEVKLYGQYTSSNTANGISFGYVESGGLTASFVTGSHYIYDRGTTASGSTSAIRGVFGLSTSIATASVANANSPLTIMSEILVTVSATGTLTFNFASESGSYSATLVAGSTMIVEKLN